MFQRTGEETQSQTQWNLGSTMAHIPVGTMVIALAQCHGRGRMIAQRQQRDGGMAHQTFDNGAEIVWKHLDMSSKELHGVATVRGSNNLF